jgi:hypothetical protein
MMYHDMLGGLKLCTNTSISSELPDPNRSASAAEKMGAEVRGIRTHTGKHPSTMLAPYSLTVG